MGVGPYWKTSRKVPLYYMMASSKPKEELMFPLKTLSAKSIPSALEMAKRYRMLNETWEAESICQDILAVEPDHQEALIVLLLAFTDHFVHELNPAYRQAMETAQRLSDHYCKAYYTGIIYERRAKAHLRKGGPGAGNLAYDWFEKAMASFDLALKGCDPDNQDAVLRWNSCARVINTHPEVKRADVDNQEAFLDSY